MIETVVSYIVIFLTIILSSRLLPSNIVLQNSFLSVFTATLWVSFLYTIFLSIVETILKILKYNISQKYTKLVFLLIYSTAFYWIAARVPGFTGFGISKYYYAILLGGFSSVFVWWIGEYFDNS